MLETKEIEAENTKYLISNSEIYDHAVMITHTHSFIEAVIGLDQKRNHIHLDVRRLIIRCFNEVGASSKLALNGYWQPAGAIMRSLLETAFLLDFLSSWPEKLQEWLENDEQKRQQQFSPFKLRTALDDRDGVNSKKREKVYKMLSNYASHPTPGAYKLISPNGLTQLGPYPNHEMLLAILQDLARIVYYLGRTLIILNNHSSADTLKLNSAYSSVLLSWCKKYDPTF